MSKLVDRLPKPLMYTGYIVYRVCTELKYIFTNKAIYYENPETTPCTMYHKVIVLYRVKFI